MTDTGIKWTDLTLGKSLNEVLKVSDRAEKAALRAGGQLIKKRIRELVRSTIKGSTKSSGQFTDKLIDAVRITKPHDGYIKYHILGTRKAGSGTYRLRFFESATKRYQTKINGKPLNKKRYIGSLSRFNGFFEKGVNTAQGSLQPVMQSALEKYINRAWNG